MPRRTDISSILIIGAGPIIIGQACEFDYSGTQACQGAASEEGYRIVLVNSNPATIMTDPDIRRRDLCRADHPRGRRAGSSRRSGRTRCCRQWAGRPRSTPRSPCSMTARWPKYGVHHDRRRRRGDRHGGGSAQRFRQAMDRIGLESPRSRDRAFSVDEALAALEHRRAAVDHPAVSFTMGGQGGGIAYNKAGVRGDRHATGST